MKTEIEIKKMGGSLMIVIPPLYAQHINVEPKDKIEMMDDDGSHGKFISFWKVEDESNNN